MGNKFDKTKLVIFDWGGIVLDTASSDEAVGKLFKELGIYAPKKTLDEPAFTTAKNLLQDTVKRSGIDYLTTHNISDLQRFVQCLGTMTGRKLDYDAFADTWNRIFQDTKTFAETTEYVKTVSQRCYAGVFSNLSFWDYPTMHKQMELAKFQYAWLSFEMGSKKPLGESFRYVSGSIPATVQDILFIDDKERNLKPARELGWKTFLGKGAQPEKIKQAVEGFLGKV